MSALRQVDLSSEILTLDEVGRRWFRVAAAVGAVGLVAGLALGAAAGDGWRRFLHAYLANFAFVTSVALGALFFTLVQHLGRAGWSVVVRRFAESVSKNLLWPLPLLAIPVLLGLSRLYPWTDAEAVAADHLLHAKAGYLNVPFFLARTVLFFAVWGGLSAWFFARSTEQDKTGDPSLTVRMERLSAPGMILFALTTTFFAFDYLMSLKPHWYSTIFGVYYFAGCIVSFFALLPIIARGVQRNGRARGLVTFEHFHDMGKLVFAFVVFWAYIGFSQFMLMWYANLPEETVWYKYRMEGSWAAVSLILLFGHFVAPFLFLLSRRMKRRTATLMAGALWLLAMHWLDVYWLVMPQAYPDRFPLGLVDVALLAGLGGVFAAVAVRRMSRHAIVPVRDPRLAESLRFENI